MIETAQAFYDMLCIGGTREQFDALVSDEIVFDDRPCELHTVGPEPLWEQVRECTERNAAAGGPRHIFRCLDYVGDSSRGAVRWVWSGVGDVAVSFGLPSSSVRFELPGVGLMSFRDGRVVSHEDIYDGAKLLRLLGANIPRRGDGSW